MSWESNELCLLQKIRDGQSGASAGSDLLVFQGFVAAVDRFEAAAIVAGVKSLKANYADGVANVLWKVPPSVKTDGLSIAQRRWLTLRYFAVMYDEHDGELVSVCGEDFAGFLKTDDRLRLVCEWLRDRGLIEWSDVVTADGVGSGRIVDAGFEVLEHGLDLLQGARPSSPIVQHIDQRNMSNHVGTINTGGGHVAVGTAAVVNVEALTDEITKLVQAIQNGPGSAAQKDEAKGLLRRFFENPSVAQAVGGAAKGISQILDKMLGGA